jgi:hypothetical protein
MKAEGGLGSLKKVLLKREGPVCFRRENSEAGLREA